MTNVNDLLQRPVAVIGGAGFVGLHVCRDLLSRGAAVMVADAFMHGERSRQAAAALPAAVGQLRVVECDARTYDPLVMLARGHDLVINLATVCVRDCLADPVLNGRAVWDLGAAPPFAVAMAGSRRYVYVSSSEVYGEAVAGPLHEGCLPRPQTAYGAAKLAGEHMAEAARLQHGLDVIVVRPFNAYGPGCHVGGVAGEAIPRWIAQAHRQQPVTVHGDGQQTRDFTFVTDLARGIVEAALSDAAVNTGPVNLCSGVEGTMIDIARDVIDVVAMARLDAVPDHGQIVVQHETYEMLRGAARPADLRRQVGCNARARVLIGWEPRVAWDEGLRLTRDDVLARLVAGEVADVPERTWA